MTASERLRELATTDFWPDPDFSAQQGSDVWQAIVSVIEAAEKWEWVWDRRDDKWRCPDCQNWEKNGHDPTCAVGLALTALREHLEEQ